MALPPERILMGEMQHTDCAPIFLFKGHWTKGVRAGLGQHPSASNNQGNTLGTLGNTQVAMLSA